MKVLKKLFYFIAVLFCLLCMGIVICAFQPDLTAKLSHFLYGEQGVADNLQNMKEQLGAIKDRLDNDGISMVPVPELGIHVGTQDGIDWGLVDKNGYELSDESTLQLPNQVLGRSDLDRIEEEGKEIAKEEEELLSQGLSQGAIGSDLSFDTNYCAYYAMLTSPMKDLYKQIYANACALTGSFQPVVKVHTSQLKTVFEAVYNDHPELFWLETGYACKYNDRGICVEITLKYNATAANLDRELALFEAAANEYLDETRKYSDLIEIETCIHDMLAEHVTYNTSAPMNQSAYSALVSGETVCAGYARAFQYLMSKCLGIPTFYCAGYSDGNHAWNIVKLDDRYANVDVTWDDAEPVSYDYFNKSDAEYRSTHIRSGLSIYLPACESEPRVVTDIGNEEHMKPLEYVEQVVEEEDDPNKSEEEHLKEAGLTEDQVIRSLEAYYNACKIKTINLGLGSHTFELYIPVSLYPEIEAVYGTDAYKLGYVDEALKKIEADEFAIQIQVVRMKGQYYYKMYHNIAVWR